MKALLHVKTLPTTYAWEDAAESPMHTAVIIARLVIRSQSSI